MKVYILEERYLEVCNCKLSKLMNDGFVYKHSDDTLWYSAKPYPVELLEEVHAAGGMADLVDDLKVELGIATAHWKAIAAANTPFVCTNGFRNNELHVHERGDAG